MNKINSHGEGNMLRIIEDKITIRNPSLFEDDMCWIGMLISECC